MARMLAVFAEFEREILRACVRAGIAQARREGRPHGRPPTASLKADLASAPSQGRADAPLGDRPTPWDRSDLGAKNPHPALTIERNGPRPELARGSERFQGALDRTCIEMTLRPATLRVDWVLIQLLFEPASRSRPPPKMLDQDPACKSACENREPVHRHAVGISLADSNPYCAIP